MAEGGDDGFDWYSYYLNLTGASSLNDTGDYNDTYDYNYDPFTFGEPVPPPCPIYKVSDGLTGILFCLAAIILVVMSFLEVRKRLCTDCCYGRPGIPVPLNFLINPKHRWIYVFMFPTMATSMIDGFYFIVAGKLDANVFSHLFWKLLVNPLLVVIFLSIQYFPLFACADAPVEIAGHAIGLVYAIVWFALYVTKAAQDYIELSSYCYYQDDFSREFGLHEDVPAGVTAILSDIPIVIASALILMWYIYQLIMDIYRCIKKPKDTSNETSDTLLKAGVYRHQISYVKKLLRKPDINGKILKIGIINRLLRMIKEAWNRDSRLPIPFIGALLGGYAIAYQLGLLVVYYGFTTAQLFREYYNDYFRVMYVDIFNNEIISELANTTITALPVAAIISPLAGLLAVLISIIVMVISVSNEIREVRREGFKAHLPAPHKRVAASWKFIGYQIGTILYGWGVYTALTFIVCVVITALDYLVDIPQLRSWAITSTIGVVVPAIWAFCVFFIQGLICKYYFFQDKNPGKFLTIKYHRIFNWFAFALIFYNGLAGVLAAVLRGLLSVAFSILLFIRLDRVILMKGFERFDKGHKTYLGFFYMDYCYNNAVIHVFLGNLAQAIVPHQNNRYKISDKTAEEGVEFAVIDPPMPADEESNEIPKTSRKIRNRWLVAYTLVRNPSLIPMTASNLEAAAVTKKLYEKQTDVDSGEKDGLESVKVDMSNVDVEKKEDTGTNL